MEKKRIKTRTEFFFFNRNQTIVLENPSEVIFMNCGSVGDRLTINNNLILDSHQTATSVGSQFPYMYTIKHNPNEVDVTNYIVRFNTTIDPRLIVIAKYYVEE